MTRPRFKGTRGPSPRGTAGALTESTRCRTDPPLTFTTLRSRRAENSGEAVWCSVLAIMCGHALANVANQVLGTEISSGAGIVSVLAVLALSASWAIVARGPRSIELVNRFVAPGLVVVTLVMLALVFTRTSWSDLVATPALDPWGDSHLDFMLAVELNIAGGFAWWPNVGNLARLTRTTRSAF